MLTLLGLVLVLIIFISPIAEYLIEKYDTQYVKREIEMEDLHINLFNGKIELKQFKLYEPKSTKLLLRLGQGLVQINPYKAAFSQEYDIGIVRFNDFEINVIQRGSQFNFDDLLALGNDDSPEPKKEELTTDTVRWWLRHIELTKGKINYNDKLVGIDLGLQQLKVVCPGLAYDKTDMRFLLSTDVSKGGNISADFKLNTTNLTYFLNANINRLQLRQFYPYLKEVLKANDLQGQLNAGFITKGNFNHADDLALKGKLGIDAFHLVDVLNDSLATFKQLNVSIDSINFKQNIFNLRNISLNTPYIKVDLFEDGTNFNRLMKLDSTTVSSTATDSIAGDSVVTNLKGSSTNLFIILADYVKTIAKEYILNSYSADNVTLTNGSIDYSDFTLGEQFYARLDSLNITSRRISSENSRITAGLSTRVNTDGRLAVNISANPKDFLEMDLMTDVQKVPIVMFNPYTLYYLAHPFKKGAINFNTTTTINANHDLKSENKLFIEKVKVGKRDKTITTATKLPIRMGVALLKDAKGNIDFKFPVTGNLDDPKYKLNKIVFKIFQNLIVKAVTSPFNAVSGLFKKKEPETEFEFNYLQQQFNERKQRKILEKLTEMMKDKPELVAEFTQNLNPEKEVEFLAYQEAKKLFLKETQSAVFSEPLSEEDNKRLIGIQNKDTAFVAFVESKTSQLKRLAPHLDKCKSLVGLKALKSLHDSLIESRERFIEDVFVNAGIDKARLMFVRNISKKSNLNLVKPTISFELDTKDEAELQK